MFKYFDNTVNEENLDNLISLNDLLGLYTLKNRDYLIQNGYMQAGFNINEMLYWPKKYTFLLYKFIEDNFDTKELPNISDFDSMFAKYYKNKDSLVGENVISNIDLLLKELLLEEVILDEIIKETNMEKHIVKNNIYASPNSFIKDYDSLDKISKGVYNECFGEKGFKTYRITDMAFITKDNEVSDKENTEFKETFVENATMPEQGDICKKYIRSEETILHELRVLKKNLTLKEFEEKGLFVFYTEDNEPCVYIDILKDYIDNFDWYCMQYKNHEIVLRRIEKECLTYLTKIECMYYLLCFGNRLDYILKNLNSINNTYKKEDIDNLIYSYKYPYNKKKILGLVSKNDLIDFLNITESEYIQLKVNGLLKEKKVENSIYYFDKEYIEENAVFLKKYLEMNNDKIYENLYNLQKVGMCIKDTTKIMLNYMFDMYKKWPLFEEETIDGLIYWYDLSEFNMNY